MSKKKKRQSFTVKEYKAQGEHAFDERCCPETRSGVCKSSCPTLSQNRKKKTQ